MLCESDKVFRDCIPESLSDGISVPCGVFPYTAGEIRNLQREGAAWMARILREVVWL